ncbi:MAG: hypothetical protein AAF216_10120 [Pseudomonadota bacterium]
MAIGLRIVGIFYRTEVDLGEEGGTVKDVLDAAQGQITAGTSFSYGTANLHGFESPNIFRAFYESGFVSPASGQSYDGGEYLLSENTTTRPSYTVWQYYIIDKHGRVLNRGNGFVRYDNPEKAKVEDGQRVVWRLLTILGEPSVASNRRLESALVS